MRRVRYEVNGGPEVLFVEEVPAPVPGPGEVLVQVEAIGVTLPVVRKVWEGGEPGPLGGEVAGSILAVGEGVTGFAPGERVTGLCFGHAYADQALIHQAMTSRIPEHASAAFPSLGSETAQSHSAPASDAAPQLSPAASLFSDANRARRDGNVDRAVALYQSLQARFPSSAESELSRALVAQMLLEHGSPEAALAGFDRYLAQGTPVLSAVALVGRARALEQLGKSAQAAVAWQEVQARFPGSVHARLAAARLVALGIR